MKNKWDKLKVDYDIWKQLTKQTGLGWSASGKDIDMPEAWWKEITKKIKGCTRFKNRDIQNEEQLEIMFEDIRNTGDDHWCASSGVAPSQFSPPPSPIPVDDQDEAVNEENDSEPEEITPTSEEER
ncbi:L10-interacting MYB domain-containing protein-like [Panicum miliaceum]|uniref:L10-interacting MYB domain-containing protein-like n=1 Tax=Panicum miliaceum TaxID=4540 RepID=A0A3L6QAC5_PANMI|nr:L10-interacting MYB domain-containing protein-like [Panicum miliaceum]